MKTRLLSCCAAALLIGQTAYAGGVDRSGQSTAVIFKEGRYAEFGLASVSPDVSGSAVGQASGNVTESFTRLSAAYKWDYSGPWDAAIIFDQPFGADINYPAATTYPLRGSKATFSSNAITLIGKYRFDGGFSLFGGMRAQEIEMEVALPAASYTASGDKTREYGYLVGAAYERKDIALRVALTYNSEIEYDIPTTENGVQSADTPITTPQSINLDFQTGVAEDTLLFGSVRWVDWPAFDISPAAYVANTGAALVSYDDTTTAFTIGIGRRFTDEWSGAVTLNHEGSGGGFASNLGPADGYTSVGLAGTYTRGDMEVTGGLEYRMIGDAETIVSSTGPITSSFTDNTSMAIGLRVGFKL